MPAYGRTRARRQRAVCTSRPPATSRRFGYTSRGLRFGPPGGGRLEWLTHESKRACPNVEARGARVFAPRCLAYSRIIRRRLLPPAAYWTSVRPVELKCESTWRYNSERCPSRPYHFSEETLLSERCFRAGSRRSVPSTCTSASKAARAYSSIGQSPRLITGLFLVRTQVGPRLPFLAAPHSVPPHSVPPFFALEGAKPVAADAPSTVAIAAVGGADVGLAPGAEQPTPRVMMSPRHGGAGNIRRDVGCDDIESSDIGSDGAGERRCALLLRSVAARVPEWAASSLEQQPGIVIRRPTYL
jgi:hypothetical protein